MVQVYALAAYVEGATARREFGIRQRGGFFTEDSSTGEYCDAALDGACSKLLVLQLLRDVSGDTFVQVGSSISIPEIYNHRKQLCTNQSTPMDDMTVNCHVNG